MNPYAVASGVLLFLALALGLTAWRRHQMRQDEWVPVFPVGGSASFRIPDGVLFHFYGDADAVAKAQATWDYLKATKPDIIDLSLRGNVTVRVERKNISKVIWLKPVREGVGA